jgi:hypothetical protein
VPYATYQPSSSRLIGIAFIVALHVALIYALVTALERRNVELAHAPIETKIITEAPPLDSQLVQSSGFPRLDQAALAGVKTNYRFIPGTVGGKPQQMWYTLKFNWKLQS